MSTCAVRGGSIHYRIFNPDASGVPCLVIHGGPGTPHPYLVPLAPMFAGHSVIFYDQLDCGRSDKPGDPANWTLCRAVEELLTLAAHLKLDTFILYAHSAGTMIAIEYALQHEKTLAGLVLASPVASVSRYHDSMKALLASFPPAIRSQFLNAYSHPASFEWMEVAAFFAENHMCRLPVWPDALLEASSATNTRLRDYLWGCNDFEVSGTLQTYDASDKLSTISVQTLITVGEHDFVSAADCRYYESLMQNARCEIIPGASHHASLENPQHYAEVMKKFLESISFPESVMSQ